MSGLSGSGTGSESIRLTAPSSAGTYYYGACVASVSGESNTNNNCSDAVRVMVEVSSGGGGAGGACSVGQVLSPGRFVVRTDGFGCYDSICAGTDLNLNCESR